MNEADFSYDSKSNILGYKKRLVGVYDIYDKCFRFDYSMVTLGIIDKRNLVIDCSELNVIPTVIIYMNITEEKWETWQRINQI